MPTRVANWIAIALLLAPAGHAAAFHPLLTRAGADDCLACHETETPRVVAQWRESRHAAVGVGCRECHGAKETNPAGRDHHGARVAAIVTPKRCGICHQRPALQYRESLHDESALFSASALGVVAGEALPAGSPGGDDRNAEARFSPRGDAFACLGCHGSAISVGEGGTLTNWPNEGMGRLNPDGSVGSCAACHLPHRFRLEQARRPETCTRCHLGPDHPQRAIYEASRHGQIYSGSQGGAAPADGASRPVEDPLEAPTCATCHMGRSGATVQPTHNVSARLKWELEPTYSWPTDEPYLRGVKRYPIDAAVAGRTEAIHGLPAGTLTAVPSGGPNPFALARHFLPELSRAYIGPGKWWGHGTTRYDALGGDARRPSTEKREEMLAVCMRCHVRARAERNLDEADAMIDVYNASVLAIWTKYYRPLKEGKFDAGMIFDGESTVDVLWRQIWKRDGRSWRMGAFMQAPEGEAGPGLSALTADAARMVDLNDRLRLRRRAPAPAPQ